MMSESATKKAFFDTMSGNLMAGDTIRILELRDNRVRSMAEGIVLEVIRNKQADKVEFFPLTSKVLKFPIKTFEKPNKEDKVPAEFIQGEGTVEYNPGKKSYMILCDGKIVSQCANKERAHAVARGDFPIPVYT